MPSDGQQDGETLGASGAQGSGPHSSHSLCLSFTSALEGAILGSNSSCQRVRDPQPFPPQQRWAVCRRLQTVLSSEPSYTHVFPHSTSVCACCLHCDPRRELENVLRLASPNSPAPAPACHPHWWQRHSGAKIHPHLDMCTSDSGWDKGPKTNNHVHIIKITSGGHKSNVVFVPAADAAVLTSTLTR